MRIRASPMVQMNLVCTAPRAASKEDFSCRGGGGNQGAEGVSKKLNEWLTIRRIGNDVVPEPRWKRLRKSVKSCSGVVAATARICDSERAKPPKNREDTKRSRIVP